MDQSYIYSHLLAHAPIAEIEPHVLRTNKNVGATILYNLHVNSVAPIFDLRLMLTYWLMCPKVRLHMVCFGHTWCEQVHWLLEISFTVLQMSSHSI